MTKSTMILGTQVEFENDDETQVEDRAQENADQTVEVEASAESELPATEESHGNRLGVESPLTPEAFEKWNARNSIGMGPKGFIGIDDIRALANYKGGGQGQILRPIDSAYLRIVMRGESPKDVLEPLMESVVHKAKMRATGRRGFENTPIEDLAESLFGESETSSDVDIYAIFQSEFPDITPESVEERMLVQPLNAEELDVIFGYEDPVTCTLDEVEFSPIWCHVINPGLGRVEGRQALHHDPLTNELGRNVRDLFMTVERGPENVEVVIGNWLIMRQGQNLVKKPFSGNAIFVKQQGLPFAGFQQRWAYESRSLQNTKVGALGLARQSLTDQLRQGGKMQKGVAYCHSSLSADRVLAGSNKIQQRQDQRNRKLSQLFGK